MKTGNGFRLHHLKAALQCCPACGYVTLWLPDCPACAAKAWRERGMVVLKERVRLRVNRKRRGRYKVARAQQEARRAERVRKLAAKLIQEAGRRARARRAA